MCLYSNDNSKDVFFNDGHRLEHPTDTADTVLSTPANQLVKGQNYDFGRLGDHFTFFTALIPHAAKIWRSL